MDRRHLKRLECIHASAGPIWFVTWCAAGRRRILAEPGPAGILRDAFAGALAHHGWRVGRYVVMPDHVHLFCCANRDHARDLSGFVQSLKAFTSRRIRDTGVRTPVWQAEFFDHLLRHGESYQAKWEYVRDNPVRAGLVDDADDWPYQGEIDEITM